MNASASSSSFVCVSGYLKFWGGPPISPPARGFIHCCGRRSRLRQSRCSSGAALAVHPVERHSRKYRLGCRGGRGRRLGGYRRDIKLRRAVERCVEIISEASRHIPMQMKVDFPEHPWEEIASIGNLLRHHYE